MEMHLKIIGTLLLVLSSIHIRFPKYFRWKEELVKISLINSQMMYVHTFFIALILFGMGMLCLYCPDEIMQTRLGKYLALGLFVFWGLRLGFQFFVYSSLLWRGKRLETFIHVLFAVLWTYFSVVFYFVYHAPR